MESTEMTETEDTARAELEKWTRLDARRRIERKGRGPDADDTDGVPPRSRGTQAQYWDEAGRLTYVEGDFWKRSEYLKCKLGIKMISDERGLPSNYQAGPGTYRSQFKRTR